MIQPPKQLRQTSLIKTLHIGEMVVNGITNLGTKIKTISLPIRVNNTRL